MFSSVSVPFASAALVNDVAYAYTQSDFAQYSLEFGLKTAGTLGGGALGSFILPGVGTVAGTVAGDYLSGLAAKGINTLAQYYAAGYTDDDWKTVLNEAGFSHASGKFGATVSSSDLSIFRPLYLDADTIANLNSLTAGGSLLSYSNDPNSVHVVRGTNSRSVLSVLFYSSPFTASQGNYIWQVDPTRYRYATIRYLRLQRYLDGVWRDYERNLSAGTDIDSETNIWTYRSQSFNVYLESGLYRF